MSRTTRTVLIAAAAAAGLVLAGAAIILIAGIGSYNSFVSLRENVNARWADVETQLQRRLDLIPNLVNTVKGYAAHEKEVLTAVTDARSRVGSAQSVPDKMKAHSELGSALSRLLVVMENYPNLKADRGFLDLQTQLEGAENRIAVARRRYNEAVQAYNTAIQRVPGRFIAGMTGFERKNAFEADQGARKAPTVTF
jgi:LemA protein